MVGAIILGLIAGVIARVIVPNDAFQNMSGPVSWLVSFVIGLGGALIGYVVFTVILGLGDTSIFDLGGIVSAIIGAVILLVIVTLVFRRTGSKA